MQEELGDQSANKLFFDHSPLGYSNRIFYSQTEILIAQQIGYGHKAYNSY